MSRNFGLDVVRAAAIGLVLLNHLGTSAASVVDVPRPLWILISLGGFYGVEIFFALSGFLIGRLLIEIVDRGDFTASAWLTFLKRRWLRTVPLYVAWVAVLLLVSPPDDPLRTGAAFLLFLQNLAWPMVDPDWFGVSWSLAVEEWFYLLFSASLLLVARTWRAMAVPLTTCMFIVAIPVLRAILASEGTPFISGLREVVLGRLDAIAYGVAIAWLWTRRAVWFSTTHAPLWPAMGWLTLVGSLTLFKAVGSRPFWQQSTLLSITSMAFAFLLPVAMKLPEPPALLARPVRWLSERSYGLYLMHHSLLHWELLSSLHAGLRAVLVLLVCGVLAELSYRYLEMPILRRRPPQFAEHVAGTRAGVSHTNARSTGATLLSAEEAVHAEQ